MHGFDTIRGYIISVGITNELDMVSIAKTRFDENGRWILIGEFDQAPTYRGVGTLTEDGYTYVNYRLGPNGEEIGKYREIVYRRRN